MGAEEGEGTKQVDEGDEGEGRAGAKTRDVDMTKTKGGRRRHVRYRRECVKQKRGRRGFLTVPPVQTRNSWTNRKGAEPLDGPRPAPW
mgnify:CR=1 FL=1